MLVGRPWCVRRQARAAVQARHQGSWAQSMWEGVGVAVGGAGVHRPNYCDRVVCADAGLTPRLPPPRAIMLSALLAAAPSILPLPRAGLPVAPIRAIGWHACRAPQVVASASALEDAQKAAAESPQQGLEELSKSVTQGLEEIVNAVSSPTEDLDRIMGAGTVTDLSNAFGLRTSMDGLRTNFDEVARSVFDLEAFPSLPPMVSSLDLLMWREQASSLMMSVRVAGVGLLLFTIVAAVAAGLIVGDRSAPPEELCNGEEELLLKEMTPERAAQWDRGGWRSGLEEAEECETGTQAHNRQLHPSPPPPPPPPPSTPHHHRHPPPPFTLHPPPPPPPPSQGRAARISEGLWLELGLCELGP